MRFRLPCAALSLAALLCSLPLPAQEDTPAASVPARSLAVEMTQAQEGAPAYIHTHYATGTGLLLHGDADVITARHNVLTPRGELAGTIGVGVPQQSLGNIVEAHSIVLAQDPDNDLVLLHIIGSLSRPTLPAHLPFAPDSAARMLLTSAPCPTAPAIEQAHRPPAVPARLRTALLVRAAPVARKKAAPPAPRARMNPPAQRARLHVVWDGPASPLDTVRTVTYRSPQPAPPVRAFLHPPAGPSTHVVWDGPAAARP